MKIPRLITLLSLGVICLTIGLSYVLWHRDRCGHLFRLAWRIDVLESRRSPPYSLSERIVGILHGSDPLCYYRTELAEEIKALTASGQIVKFSVPYGPEGNHSDREIAMAAVGVRGRIGAEYWIDCDRSNRLMFVVCRSADAPAFSAAFK